MRWWSSLRGYDFPRTTGRDSVPLGPRSLSRSLVRAARKDARQQARRGRPGGIPAVPDAPHSAAVIAAVPEPTRRRIALRIQQERTGLTCRDEEWWTAKALAAAHCGWEPVHVHTLFAYALFGVHGHRPVTAWTAAAGPALELPLAALEELPEHGPFMHYLRTALTARLGCHSQSGPGPAAATEEQEQDEVTERLHRLLRLPFRVDRTLHPGLPYTVAARCGLGTTLYDPGVLELLRRCALVEGLRPDYAWLGAMREHLEQSRAARDALPPLLAAATGRPDDCPNSRAHRGELGPAAGQLLGALAWAACLQGRLGTLQELGAALRQHAQRPMDDLPYGDGVFLRSGCAALAALAGEPGTGAHHRVLAGTTSAAAGLARELLGELRRQPAYWDANGLHYEVGRYTAVFTVGSDGAVSLGFRNRHGRMLADVPSRVRVQQPLLYAALRARLAELRAQTAAHRGSLAERLHQDDGMPAAAWRTTHLDVPALEPLTRALVWQADTPNGPAVGLPVRRRRSTQWVLRELRGGVRELTDTTRVRLWDPRTADLCEVRAWRETLGRRRLVQPVPQLSPPA